MRLRDIIAEYEEETLRGEYWIDDGGNLLEADGDIGAYNHEAHVIELLQYQISDKFGDYRDGEYVDWDRFKEELAKETYKEQIKLNPSQHKQLRIQWIKDDGEHFLLLGLRQLGVTDDEYATAEGFGDARVHAMQHWGWKRVVDSNVETWNLTPEDMRTIASGIGEIMPESDADVEVSVYVHTSGKSFDFKLSELETGHKVANAPAVPYQDIAKAATANVRELEKGSVNPYYRQRTFPMSEQR